MASTLPTAMSTSPARLLGLHAGTLAEGAPADVVHAIAYHTTGCADMTLLDKIVYMADYIEENRSFDGVKTARKLAARNLDKALLYGMNSSLRDLIHRGKQIHVDTVSARNWLLEHM